MSAILTDDCPPGRCVGETAHETQKHISTLRTIYIEDNAAWDALRETIACEPLTLTLIGPECYRLSLPDRGWRHD